MINEAVLCLQEGIIESVKDGDLGAILGIGFRPFTGGPFRYADHVGCDFIIKELNKLESKYGSRFSPCELLKTFALSGEKFYSL